LGTKWLEAADLSFGWILLPLVILENLFALLLTDLRARRRSVAYSLSTVVRLLVIVGASLWVIAVKDMGLYGLFLGRMMGSAVGVGLLLILALQSILLKFSLSIITPMLRYGYPLVLGTFLAILTDASSRYFLNYYSTPEQVGYYGVAIKISGIFQMLIVQPFGVAWGGLMFQIAKWPHARLIYSKVLSYTLIVSMFIALIISLFTPLLFRIFATEEYAPGMAVFPLIIFTRAVTIMMYPAGVGIYLGNRTKSLPIIYLASLLTNVMLCYLLVPRYGMAGAAWSWLITWMLIIILMGSVGQRCYPLDIDWKMIAIPVTVWGILLVPGLGIHMLGDVSIAGLISATILAALKELGVGLLIFRDIKVTQMQLLSIDKVSSV